MMGSLASESLPLSSNRSVPFKIGFIYHFPLKGIFEEKVI